MDQWHDTKEERPEPNRLVIGMDNGGFEHELIFHRNRFWTRDLKMYVYFSPVRWKYDEKGQD